MAVDFEDSLTQYLHSNGVLPSGLSGLPVSMAAWVQMGEFDLDTIIGVNVPVSAANGNARIFIRATKKISALIFDTASTEVQLASPLHALGTWHHIAAAFSATTLTIWLDGTAASGAHTRNPTYTEVMLAVHARSTPTQLWNGRMAEAGFWSTELVQADVDALAGGRRPPTVQSSTCRAYWDFQNSGDYTDKIGGLTLTPVNTPTFSSLKPNVYRGPLSRLRRSG